MLSKIQRTVIYYKLKSPTHTDEVTIIKLKRWNRTGNVVANRTIKKKIRVWLAPEIALAK